MLNLSTEFTMIFITIHFHYLLKNISFDLTMEAKKALNMINLDFEQLLLSNIFFRSCIF